VAGMTEMECQTNRLDVTESLMLGRPLSEPLVRHVERCSACAQDLAEVHEVKRALDWMSQPVPFDPGRPAGHPELGERITRRVRSVRMARQRRIVISVAAAAVIGVAGLIPVFGGVGGPLPEQSQSAVQTVALVRTGRMVAQPWGTVVPVALSGLTPGHIYRLMTTDASGRQVQAGSVRSANGLPISTSMTTAMSRDSINALLVLDDQGRKVAELRI